MTSAKVLIHKVNLHPLRPLPLAQRFEANRQVLRLTVRGPDGERYADVAPLPYLHQESLSDCLDAAIEHFQGRGGPRPPALDSALGFLEQEASSEERKGHWENSALLSLDQPVTLPIEARVCKVKTGRSSLQDLATTLRSLLREREDREFRIDCNRALESGSLSELKDLVATFPITYFEEPFRSLDELKAFARELPLALDESLGQDAELDALAKAWVIKPNVLGFAATRSRLQDSSPVLKVLSNSFESDATLQLYAYFYRHWVDKPQALGFGTAFYFPDGECEWNPRTYRGAWPAAAYSRSAFEGELLWQN